MDMAVRIPGGLRWFFNFSGWEPTKPEIMRAFAAIQEEEKTRIHQFRYQADAKASLVGRLMLRRAATLLLQPPPNTNIQQLNNNIQSETNSTSIHSNAIRFGRTDRGRPFIENVCGVELNVSHAGSLTVLAAQTCADKHLQLGIDVMPLKDSRVERLDEFFRLMRRQFTDAEWDTILGHPSDQTRIASFYRHWSLKESYVKAVGTGLNIDLRTINFVTHSPTSAVHTVTDTEVWIEGVTKDWVFEESLLDDHVISVASSPSCQHSSMVWAEMKISDILPEEKDLLHEMSQQDWELFSKKTKLKPF